METKAIAVENCANCPFCIWDYLSKKYRCDPLSFLIEDLFPEPPMEVRIGSGEIVPTGCPLKDKDILIGLRENHKI